MTLSVIGSLQCASGYRRRRIPGFRRRPAESCTHLDAVPASTGAVGRWRCSRLWASLSAGRTISTSRARLRHHALARRVHTSAPTVALAASRPRDRVMAWRSRHDGEVQLRSSPASGRRWRSTSARRPSTVICMRPKPSCRWPFGSSAVWDIACLAAGIDKGPIERVLHLVAGTLRAGPRRRDRRRRRPARFSAAGNRAGTGTAPAVRTHLLPLVEIAGMAAARRRAR